MTAMAPLAVPLKVMIGPSLPKLPTFILGRGGGGGGGKGGDGGGVPSLVSNQISTFHGIPFINLRDPSSMGWVNSCVPFG